VLGWDAETRARELTHYQARVRAERESQTQPDDLTADAARLGAPDVRLGARGPGAVLHLAERRGGERRTATPSRESGDPGDESIA